MERRDEAVSMIIGGARVVLAFTVILSLALLPSTGVAHAAGSESQLDPALVIQVEVSRGELTVDVRQIPLARVLEIVGEGAGLTMTLNGDLGAPITDSFVGLPLEEGIRRLARGHSTAVTYGVVARGTVRLVEVRVMAGGSGPSSPSPIAAPPRRQDADSRVADAAGEPLLAPQIGEIQGLAGDAALGSGAALTRLAEIGAAGDDAALREQAVAALGRLNDSRAEPALLAALSDEDGSVRMRAIRGLRTFGTEAAAASIADVLIADADPQVRLTALAAVGSLSGPRVPTMLQRASTDPNVTVRETALRWLAWWRSRGPATP